MQDQNKENNDFNNQNCFNQGDNYNSKNCYHEKKVIMYLIIIALLLCYCSLFFIHNINFRANKKDKELLDMEYNEKDDENKQNNNTIGNNITNGNNNIINGIISGNSTNNNLGDDQTSNPNGGLDNPGGDMSNQNGESNNPGGDTNNPNGGSNNPGGNTDNPNGGSNNPGGNTDNPGGGTSKPGEGTSIPDEEIVDNKDRFKITQGSKEWKDLKSLNIFNNSYFNGNSIIAPNVHGKYNFTVENYKDAKIIYNFNFTETNAYNINMVYKLKRNGLYIAGNEHTFVKYKELNIDNILINEHTKDVYTLEWKWQDSDNDTQIGKTQGANYKLNIEVNASELNN